MKIPRNFIKKGQVWKSKDTGKVVRVLKKSTGNLHWLIDNGHHIHEGTLIKFYELISV